MAEIEVGQVLAGCAILRELGRGGMGVVYLGRHTRLDALRAVKVLPREHVTDTAIARFWREAQAASKIDHPNVVTIHDVGHERDWHYIVMQYVDGRTLREWVEAHGPASGKPALPWGETFELIVPVLDALTVIHKCGLVHRDIKPSNIMVAEKSTGAQKRRVVLMDFGLVLDDSRDRLTSTGLVLGTPAYMAPEQARGSPVDPRADLYSVGATMYALLAGRPPFPGPQAEVLVEVAGGKRPQPLSEVRQDLPDRVGRIIERAMEPDRSWRYADAEQMLDDVRSALDASGLPETIPYSVRPEPAELAGAAVALGDSHPGEGGVSDNGALCETDLAALVPLEPTNGLAPPPRPALPPRRAARRADRSPDRFLRRWGGLVAMLAILLLLIVGIGLLMERSQPEPAGMETPLAAKTPASPSKTRRASLDGMVYIPAGLVHLGATDERLRAHADALGLSPRLRANFLILCRREKVAHVYVDGFWIDKYEVTNAQYARFVQATGHRRPPHWPDGNGLPGKETHPVTQVTYDDAMAYAAWVGKKLPTIVQWTRAFRGDDDRMYPWGDTWEDDRANVLQNTAFPAGTSPVDSTPRDVSPFGVFNLVGNVDEILRDRLVEDGRPAAVTKGANSESLGHIFGAAPLQFIPVHDGKRDGRGDLTGFRCVVEQPR